MDSVQYFDQSKKSLDKPFPCSSPFLLEFSRDIHQKQNYSSIGEEGEGTKRLAIKMTSKGLALLLIRLEMGSGYLTPGYQLIYGEKLSTNDILNAKV